MQFLLPPQHHGQVVVCTAVGQRCRRPHHWSHRRYQGAGALVSCMYCSEVDRELPGGHSGHLTPISPVCRLLALTLGCATSTNVNILSKFIFHYVLPGYIPSGERVKVGAGALLLPPYIWIIKVGAGALLLPPYIVRRFLVPLCCARVIFRQSSRQIRRPWPTSMGGS